MHPEYTDQLSAYLDGELPPAERTALEAHLDGCAECRAILDDLRAIVAAAPAYEGTLPDRDLWPAIQSGIDARREVAFTPRASMPAGRRLFTLRELIAASVACAAVVGGVVYAAVSMRTLAAPVPVAVEAPRPAMVTSARALPSVSERAGVVFDQAVGDLERVLADGRDKLEPRTLKVIEDNLKIIDRALAEARAAIAADPANAYLTAQVAANMRRKLEILRSAAGAIAAAES